MIIVYRADNLKRFAPFSYLNHSFTLSVNVKVCIRLIVFLQILLFFYLSRVTLDEMSAIQGGQPNLEKFSQYIPVQFQA